MKLELVTQSIGVDAGGGAWLRLIDGTWRRAPALDDDLSRLCWACWHCGTVTFALPTVQCTACGRCSGFARLGTYTEAAGRRALELAMAVPAC